jgi:hypothetical protein
MRAATSYVIFLSYTKRAQTPHHGKIYNPDLNEGDQVFVAPKRETVALVEPCAKEEAAWRRVRDIPRRAPYRVARGGDWSNLASACRSAHRWPCAPGDLLCGWGFRLSRTASGR